MRTYEAEMMRELKEFETVMKQTMTRIDTIAKKLMTIHGRLKKIGD